ncbi:unnamed protein product [Acanthoscelides obtectus]|uniref:Uncharacterized protein n=1 Tax=Acanthoscelides obtectus TaxID=200917 RepID=A0A9P0P7R3_ACAOB|nr:unnamed protein product [Acanthoscelides obtectus]CAK1627847.1 hypothetical protein AOBTE_LOCUS4859 [Acanthoscelides obtectus]
MTEVDAVATRAALRPSSSVLHTCCSELPASEPKSLQSSGTRYCYNMAPRKKTQTKEEILQKKRDAVWKKYERLKNDPRRREKLREKGHLKYLEKEEGKRV